MMPSSNLTGSILVADDNTDIRRMLAIQLSFLGHTVTEARDGQETLDLISSQSFDLVLLGGGRIEERGAQHRTGRGRFSVQAV